MKNHILVTGGAGYIGSHTVLTLLEDNYKVTVIDNLSNGYAESIERVEKLTNKKVNFYKADVRDKVQMRNIFSSNNFTGVIHFAGCKAVGESHNMPLHYYDVNVSGTIALVEVMNEFKIKKLIFSSSATVYGEDAKVPYLESFPRGKSSSPYGSSKAMIENILEDICQSDKTWSITLLRYFNPIGAHPTGIIGEDPKGIPNNLLPYIAQVAVGNLKFLPVFGDDYSTPDGTCRRDYIHIMDLAAGHVAGLKNQTQTGCQIYNLGTGKPYSVLEIIKEFSNICGKDIPYRIKEKRIGDLPEFWADSSKAKKGLNWKARLSLREMIKDTWNWQKKNQNGYSE